jgi:hypothetical protein
MGRQRLSELDCDKHWSNLMFCYLPYGCYFDLLLETINRRRLFELCHIFGGFISCLHSRPAYILIQSCVLAKRYERNSAAQSRVMIMYNSCFNNQYFNSVFEFSAFV